MAAVCGGASTLASLPASNFRLVGVASCLPNSDARCGAAAAADSPAQWRLCLCLLGVPHGSRGSVIPLINVL